MAPPRCWTRKKQKRASSASVASEVQDGSELDSLRNLCRICHRPSLRGNEYKRAGKFYKLGKHYYHYFCVLFSAGISASGSRQEGLHGFLSSDIDKVLAERAEDPKICDICDQAGATVSCAHLKCSLNYHFSCGVDEDCAFVFACQMVSYCFNHLPKPKQRAIKVNKDPTCLAGCQEKILTGSQRFMVSPCCGRKYHVECLQDMACSSGKHHFKCPVCSNKDKFCKEAERMGLYIPEKDASWEQDEAFYGFSAQGRLYQYCDAERCKCPKGREHSMNGSKFEVIRCDMCGCGAIHIYCGRLLKQSPYYVCSKHAGAQRAIRSHIKDFRKSADYFSDAEYSRSEDDDEDDDDEDDDEDEDDNSGLDKSGAEISSALMLRGCGAIASTSDALDDDDHRSMPRSNLASSGYERDLIEITCVSSNDDGDGDDADGDDDDDGDDDGDDGDGDDDDDSEYDDAVKNLISCSNRLASKLVPLDSAVDKGMKDKAAGTSTSLPFRPSAPTGTKRHGTHLSRSISQDGKAGSKVPEEFVALKPRAITFEVVELESVESFRSESNFAPEYGSCLPGPSKRPRVTADSGRQSSSFSPYVACISSDSSSDYCGGSQNDESSSSDEEVINID